MIFQLEDDAPNFILTKIPMPPTVNRFLMPSRGRLVHTPEARLWKNKINMYKNMNRQKLEEIEDEIKLFVSNNESSVFSVDCFFLFPKDKLWTKSNSPKKMDGNNRLKPILDAVESLIALDDKYYWSGVAEKVEAKSTEVVVHFQLIEPENQKSLFDRLNVPY